LRKDFYKVLGNYNHSMRVNHPEVEQWILDYKFREKERDLCNKSENVRQAVIILRREDGSDP
jgi:hypothetical protein